MEKIRIKLLRTLACPPFFGTQDDVLELPIALALDVLEQGNGVCVNEQFQADFEKAKATGELEKIKKYLASAPAEEDEEEEEEEQNPIVAVAAAAAVEAKVDEHLAGLDDLFNKQSENQAALAELAAENPKEPEAPEAAKSKKGK